MLAGSESSKFRACGSNIYDPNIYGGSNVVGYASPNVDVLGTGAFSAMTRWVSSLQISTDGTNASSIQFDAGNSNHLYGLSGTVHQQEFMGSCY